jgi:mannose-6-phosphate isomerase-like protein (cupin superfamily)
VTLRILSKETAPRYTRDDIVSYLLVSEQTCESEKLTTTIVEMQAGGIQRVHSHEPEQMYYILEGVGIITVGDETRKVKAGDCVFFSSFTPHGLQNTGEAILKYFSAASPSFSAEESEKLWPLKSLSEE